MAKSLGESVVVITGASSGIGRETALKMADAGARLVLAARDKRALEEVVRLCEERGAQAIAVPTDVSAEGEVDALAKRAIEAYGKIDVWINDAAAYMMGRAERVPGHSVRRLFEVNVMGVVHGSVAAVAHFRERNAGVLINIGSIAGKAPYALASAYCASKHAVHGFTEALRQELATTNIHACLVVPATVDTPLFDHAANYTGRTIEAMRPIYPVEKGVDAIVDCALHPRREVLVGAAPRMLAAMSATMPGLMERVEPKLIDRDHLGAEPRGSSSGNLYLPGAPHETSGHWRERKPSFDVRRLKDWLFGVGRRLPSFAKVSCARRARRVKALAARRHLRTVSRCAWMLLAAAFAACGIETEEDEQAREAEAEEYCDAYLDGGCSVDEAYAECRACYVGCGGPCRANASCGNTEFDCE
jgi:short-subunit dehydrogenase